MTEKKRSLFPLGSLGPMGSIFGSDARGKKHKRDIGTTPTKNLKKYNREYYRKVRSPNKQNIRKYRRSRK